MIKTVTLTVIIICLAAVCAFAGPGTIDSLKAATERATQDTDKINLLIALSQNFSIKDTIEKVTTAQKALGIAKQVNSENYLMKCYQNLGFLYLVYIKDYAKAAEYYSEYGHAAEYAKDTIRQIEAFEKLIVVYDNMSKYTLALQNGNNALQLHPDKVTEANILGNMGSTYLKIDDYSTAMKYYTRSLKVTEQIMLSKKSPTHMDSMQEAALVYSIGNIYGKMEEYSRALDNYNKAITISNNDNDIALLALMGKGAIFEMKGDYPSAKDMYKKALSTIRSEQHNENLTNIYTSLASEYLKTGEQQTAKNYADSALSLAKQYGEEAPLPKIYIVLAKINNLSQKYGASVAYLEDAIRITRNSGALQDENDAWEALSNTYEAMKRPADAFAAYKRYIGIRDSIDNIEKAKAINRMDVETNVYTMRVNDSIKAVKQAAEYNVKMQKQQVLAWGGYAGVAALLLLSFFIYRGYSQQKKANVLVSRANEKINDEKQVSEALLRNILPEDVARELKARGDVQPKMFDNVTVLFTDFVNFTTAGDHMSPQELVAELHTCFKSFDRIIGKYNIEKIKTVGDAYIAVSGLPQPNANHAADIIKAALEIRDYMLERKKEFPANTFGIRLGVNSGPVVAGIVGVTKFAYDIWGDTVNVAARMEQYGEEGKVNISEKTHTLVKNTYACMDRGIMDVKNKGSMNMYFVEGVV